MEIELKFQIPTESKAALEKFIKSKGGTSKRLRAKYFDTDTRLLAKSNIALRLRKEGHVWYQTLKVAPQTANVVRHEDTVRLVTPRVQIQRWISPVIARQISGQNSIRPCDMTLHAN
jgi:triphosphatase